MKQISLIIMLSLITYCSTQSMPAEFPRFKIHLDTPADQRFVEVTQAMMEPTLSMFNKYISVTPKFLQNIFEEHEKELHIVHREQYLEINSISTILGLPSYQVFLLNYLYELEDALCTSVVARQADGTIIHGRNLDFGFADAMRNASYVGQFYKNGKHIYDAVMFGGYVGVLSAHRFGAFSATVNTRGMGNRGVVPILEVLASMFEGHTETGIAVRDVFSQCEDYDCAVSKLGAVRIIAPVYFTIAGTKDYEGMVMSRNADGIANIHNLDENTWYVLQTNDDHFAGVCNERCQDGNNHMMAVGQEAMNTDLLLNQVMLQSHTFNKHTIYTTISVPSKSQFDVHPEDTDMPYVKEGINFDNFNFLE